MSARIVVDWDRCAMQPGMAGHAMGSCDAKSGGAAVLQISTTLIGRSTLGTRGCLLVLSA